MVQRYTCRQSTHAHKNELETKRTKTQDIRFGSMCLYSMSRLAGPRIKILTVKIEVYLGKQQTDSITQKKEPTIIIMAMRNQSGPNTPNSQKARPVGCTVYCYSLSCGQGLVNCEAPYGKVISPDKNKANTH